MIFRISPVNSSGGSWEEKVTATAPGLEDSEKKPAIRPNWGHKDRRNHQAARLIHSRQRPSDWPARNSR